MLKAEVVHVHGSDEAESAEHRLLARIAYRYYIDGRTQQEIGAEFDLSRPKVQRLLSRARELGIVEIRIRSPQHTSLALEAQLRDIFDLRDALVSAPQPGPQLRRQGVALAAAEYLERRLAPGDVVTVGMGRNTGELASAYRPARRLGCTFVSAMGGSPGVDAPTNPNDICRLLAERWGGRAESLYAPAYVESSDIRDRILEQDAVRHSLSIAADAAFAVVGIGGTEDDCTMVRSGCCSVAEMAGLRSRGAVGDILGNYFDLDGRMMAPDLRDRLLGLTLDDLRRIETVVAIVSEDDKSAAVLGALRTGVVDVLIVDEANAARLIEAGPAAGSRESVEIGR